MALNQCRASPSAAGATGPSGAVPAGRAHRARGAVGAVRSPVRAAGTRGEGHRRRPRPDDTPLSIALVRLAATAATPASAGAAASADWPTWSSASARPPRARTTCAARTRSDIPPQPRQGAAFLRRSPSPVWKRSSAACIGPRRVSVEHELLVHRAVPHQAVGQRDQHALQHFVRSASAWAATRASWPEESARRSSPGAGGPTHCSSGVVATTSRPTDQRERHVDGLYATWLVLWTATFTSRPPAHVLDEVAQNPSVTRRDDRPHRPSNRIVQLH
jgi:hypothetical protein